MKTVNPYLTFAGNTLEAFEFYRSVFGGEFIQMLRFRDMPDSMGVPDEALDSIAHISLPLGGGVRLLGSDQPATPDSEPLRVGTNVSLNLEAEDAAEARKLFEGLSAGGEVSLELQDTGWAELYGQLTDRFGIGWSIIFAGGRGSGGA
jgi:PhnB protein